MTFYDPSSRAGSCTNHYGLTMPVIPRVNHQAAVRALQKIGFKTIRQGKHIVMSNGTCIVTIPRHNPMHAVTMGYIARTAG